MTLIKLEKVSRYYLNSKKEKNYALKEFSFTFPQNGLVTILGKSGSGKSTLLNLIGLLDKPSEGEVYLFDKPTNKLKDKKKNHILNEQIGIVFQHYNLLEKESALTNIMFPMLIKGERSKYAQEDALTLAKGFGFDEEFLNKIAENLSGGEKQRVAILRSIINDPSIVLADEPTGALDTNNSHLILDLLKKISNKKLVIMVSHNEELAREYSDLILTLKDGELINVEELHKIEEKPHPENEFKKSRKSNHWEVKQSLKLIKRKKTKNIISLLSLSIGLLSSMMIIGFSSGASDAVIEESYNQIDYGVLTVSHETVSGVAGTQMSVIRETRPTKKEINRLQIKYPNLTFSPSISYYFPSNIEIKIGEETFDTLAYSPLYSLDEEFLNTSLLIKGEWPKTSNQTIINKSAYTYMKKYVSEPLNTIVTISALKEIVFQTGKEANPTVTDYFSFTCDIEIVGVVDDFNFLTTSKLFYSYVSNLSILENTLMENLSAYVGEEISYYDYLLMSADDSDISNYEYVAFYNDPSTYEEIDNIYNDDNNEIVFSSLGIERKEACLSLVDACTIGMDIYLVVALIGTFLIVGIVSFSSYSEERKNTAIMMAMGASTDSNVSIYLYNNLFLGLISLTFTFLISPILAYLLNTLLTSLVSIPNLISLPFRSFLGYKYLFPILIVGATLLVIFISTYLPIMISKKINLVEELKEE